MHVLVTRPGTDAERTAEALRSQGHAVTLAPMLTIEPVIDADLGPGPYAAVVMTSANAARVIARHRGRDEILSLPVYTVGRHTAQAAAEAGFDEVESADGGWPDLVRLVAQRVSAGGQPLLYLAAEERSGDIAGALAAHDLTVETVVIYRAVANPTFAQDLRAALSGALDGVLHYSRRSAQMFLTGARSAGRLNAALAMSHFCLSSEVAAPLRAAGAERVKVAPRPEEAALIALLSFDGSLTA
jgi:uroporphyrinogen-III synthase